MALDTRTKRPPVRPKKPSSKLGALWHSTIGKKVIMAVGGLVMIGYLILHMVGNLKIFSGAEAFNGYSHWIRTVGYPVLPHEGLLWIIRVVLLVSVVLHFVAAVQLSHRSIHGRARSRARNKIGANYVAFSMRSGGIILALFIVWHLLDLTTLTVNPRAEAGHPYENVLATFGTWYGNVIYIVAVVAMGLHVRHGFWAAAQTLGAGGTGRDRSLRAIAAVLALALTIGFVAVPVAVMTGVVS